MQCLPVFQPRWCSIHHFSTNKCIFTDFLGRRASQPAYLPWGTQGSSDKTESCWAGGVGDRTAPPFGNQKQKEYWTGTERMSIKQSPPLPSSPPVVTVIPSTSCLKMQRAFQKIICINAGFEVQAAGISLQTEIKPRRLRWAWACWTSFTHHRSAKLSKCRGSLCVLLSQP